MANAYHHRSDAYSSVVALFAILGSSWFPALPLDPIGGFLVSVVILRQGLGLFGGAFGEITDRSAGVKTVGTLNRALDAFVARQHQFSPSPFSSLSTHSDGTGIKLKIHSLRAKRTGSELFVDLVADVPGHLSVEECGELERGIVECLKGARREVREVGVRFRALGEGKGEGKGQEGEVR